ncbi:MAG: PSD1 domain-containing protein [Planctomycetes bacterium]|nr:PSD1 domain-containing protein [Planctomycetota bacterium]
MKSPLTVLLSACFVAGAFWCSSLAGPVSQVDAAGEQGAPEASAPSEGERLFRERVLPTFEASCFECHGPDARRAKGGLRMSGREGLLRGGTSGPAIDLDEPGRSLLLELVRHTDEDFRMPPDEVLDEGAIDDLERWIELGAPWAAAASEEVSPELAAFFEREVRPLLAARCFPCHGPDVEEPRSGLRMSGRDALLKGSRFGPSIVPGDPDESRLVRAIRYNESSLKMPPESPLPADEVAVLERWVALGAPWPGGEALAPDEDQGEFDLDAARQTWPFRPLTRPEVPVVNGVEYANPVDAFLAERLDAAGLQPNGRATDRELVRRAYMDLIGLPPAYEIVELYAQLDDPDKWDRLIDYLLDKRAYGERWGRYWLDVVRFAQTDGFEEDAEKAYAWRYRDYVIRAFNEDLPYDRFVKQQIAGDELEPGSEDALIATGVYHIGPYEEGEEIAEQTQFEGYDDMLRVFTEGFMGMTIGCARCHDHEYDPVRQDEYYGLLAFIRNVEPYTLPVFSPTSRTLAAVDFDELAQSRWDEQRLAYARQLNEESDQILADQRRRLLEALVDEHGAEARNAYLTPANQRTPDQQHRIDELARRLPGEKGVFKSLEMHDSVRYRTLKDRARRAEEGETFEGSVEWVLCAQESSPEVPPTHVMALGKANSKLHTVEPRFPPVFVPDDEASWPEIPEPPAGSKSSGRGSVLANWIASADNPLTARVMVNRVWQGHFGRGIVATPNDFGGSGVAATHPELIDWLAAEFIARGWSVKELHRVIMRSDAYQRSSSAANAGAVEADPGNDLIWRQNLRRLDAEILRDALLTVSGELKDEMGGRGFFPELSREALAGGSKPGDGWGVSSPDQRARRAVYAYVKRGMLEPMLEVFDCANPVLPVGARAETTTSNQNLMMLNSDFVNQRASVLANRVRRQVGQDADADAARVERLFELVLSRRPTEAERAACLDYLSEQTQAFADVGNWIALDPQVPDRLQDDFLDGLPPSGMLFGPRQGWTYVRGLWGNSYNNTREVDLERGPAALSPVSFTEGEVSAELRLADGCRFGSVILRGSTLRNAFAGVEVRLDYEAGALRVLQHGVFEDLPAKELARVPLQLEYGRTYRLLMSLTGDALAVELDGDQLANVAVAGLPTPGRLGLRCWGDTFEVRGLRVALSEGAIDVEPEATSDPRERAFDSLCLAALNFNEFIYVD